MASPRSRTHQFFAPSSLAILWAMAGLALAGCNPAAPTNSAADNTAAVNEATGDAPADADLPAAAAAPVAPAASPTAAYAEADQASDLSDAFADAPPDFTYDYDGAQSSVWRTHDNYERIAEQTSDGPRVYYFAPGATQPFYIQASDYGYGFQGGALVAVYDSHGHQLAQPAVAQQADMAGRFLQRAHALQQGAQQQPHQNGPPPNWTQQRSALDAQTSRLTQDQQSNPDWQAYHAQHGAADTTRWAADRAHNLAQTSGPPPGAGGPAASGTSPGTPAAGPGSGPQGPGGPPGGGGGPDHGHGPQGPSQGPSQGNGQHSGGQPGQDGHGGRADTNDAHRH
ncbi:MAG TPA: hypothetical protein VHW60_06880 [Caulobacteraceae bacterium]|jgi:hypothetical protein|nr:hypothetical protein [Caulobacteraceae bacterium]